MQTSEIRGIKVALQSKPRIPKDKVMIAVSLCLEKDIERIGVRLEGFGICVPYLGNI